MEHRHIHTGHLADPDFGSIAAVLSVFERGDYDDMRDLYRRVWSDPWGDVAEVALRAANISDVYGRPLTLKRMIHHRRELCWDG